MLICGLQVHLDLLVRRVLMVLQVKLDPKDLLVSQVCRKQCRKKYPAAAVVVAATLRFSHYGLALYL